MGVDVSPVLGVFECSTTNTSGERVEKVEGPEDVRVGLPRRILWWRDGRRSLKMDGTVFKVTEV